MKGSITTSPNLPLASHTGNGVKKGLCWHCRSKPGGPERPTRSDRPVRPVVLGAASSTLLGLSIRHGTLENEAILDSGRGRRTYSTYRRPILGILPVQPLSRIEYDQASPWKLRFTRCIVGSELAGPFLHHLDHRQGQQAISTYLKHIDN